MKVLVLGIGNVLFADEGVGAHFVSMMEENFSFTSAWHTIKFIDGGTLANALISLIVKHDYLILIDCVDAQGGEPGDIYYFDYEDLPKSISFSGSAHELEMLQTLCMMDLAGDRPPTKILGIVPERTIPMSFDLSLKVSRSIPLMEQSLLKILKELGFTYIRKNNKSIQDISNKWKVKF